MDRVNLSVGDATILTSLHSQTQAVPFPSKREPRSTNSVALQLDVALENEYG